MAFTVDADRTVTRYFDAVVVVHEYGVATAAGVATGHRVKVDGVAGDVVPLTRVAENGDYRGVANSLRITHSALPELFKVTEGVEEPPEP